MNNASVAPKPITWKNYLIFFAVSIFFYLPCALGWWPDIQLSTYIISLIKRGQPEFQNFGLISLVLNTIITEPIILGLLTYLWKQKEGKQADIKDIFYWVRGRYLIKAILFGLISSAVLLLYIIVFYIGSKISPLFTLLGLLLSVIYYIPLLISLMMAAILMAQNPDESFHVILWETRRLFWKALGGLLFITIAYGLAKLLLQYIDTYIVYNILYGKYIPNVDHPVTFTYMTLKYFFDIILFGLGPIITILIYWKSMAVIKKAQRIPERSLEIAPEPFEEFNEFEELACDQEPGWTSEEDKCENEKNMTQGDK